MLKKWLQSKRFETGIGIAGVFYMLFLCAATVFVVQFIIRETFLSFGVEKTPTQQFETFDVEAVQ